MYSKPVTILIIVLCILAMAFSPLKKKPVSRESLFDVSSKLLILANENPGKVQSAKYKQYTLYLKLLPETDWLGRNVYRIGISQTGRYPKEKVFTEYRNALPRVEINIDGVLPWKERNGRNFILWDEVSIGSRPKPEY